LLLLSSQLVLSSQTYTDSSYIGISSCIFLPVILTEDASKYGESVIPVDIWLRLIIAFSKIHTAYFQFPVPRSHINVTCGPIAVNARNKCATNNRVNPFLGNACPTRTQDYNRCCKRRPLCGFAYIHC
jgi:hypothetical protein